MSVRHIAAIAVVLIAPALGAAAAWPQGGGDAGASFASGDNLQTAFSTLWMNGAYPSVGTDGRRCVVSNGNYVATTLLAANGSTSRLAVFDASTGALVWREATARTWAASGGRSCIAMDGQTVVGWAGQNDLRAYSVTDGALLWTDSRFGWDLLAPTISGGRVFVAHQGIEACPPVYQWYGSSGSTMAIDAASGAEVWRTAGEFSRPIVAQGRVLSVDCHHYLVARNPTTGVAEWTGDTVRSGSLPTIGDYWASGANVYVTEATLGGGDSRITALAASTGGRLWTHALPGGVSFATIPRGAGTDSLVVVYVTGSDLSAYGVDTRYALLALDAATGNQAWVRELASGPDRTPIITQGHVVDGTSIRRASDGAVVPSSLDRVGGLRGPFGLVDGYLFGWRESAAGWTVARTGALSPPAAPAGLSVSASSGQAFVSWDPVSIDGSDDGITYTVTASPGGQQCTQVGAAFPGRRACTVAGLSNGVTYTFTVKGANAAGDGPASSPTTPVTPVGTTPPIALNPGSGGPCGDSLAPPPGPVGVSINDGAQYTNEVDVELSVVWPTCTTRASVANDGGFRRSRSVPVARSIAWTLAYSGPERLPKTVYLRFDGTGANYTDDIILDRTNPWIDSALAQEIAWASEAASRGRGIRLQLRARDRTSGVAFMQATSSKTKPGPKRAYSPVSRVRMTGSAMYVRVQDRAGNWSKWRTVRVG